MNIASNWWHHVENLIPWIMVTIKIIIILIIINLRNIMIHTRILTNLLKYQTKCHILMYLYEVHINIVHSSIGLCNILELETKTSSNVKKI